VPDDFPSPEHLRNHHIVHDLDVHFPGIDERSHPIIVMPAVYRPDTDIPPPEVQAKMNELKAQGFAFQAVRIDLSAHFPCDVCGQDCITSSQEMADQQAAFPRVCWDCIEEQAPGFIASIQEKYGA